MIFTVTYRNKEGQRVSKTFEAESRAHLFEQLKNCEIKAIRVDTGKPGAARTAIFPHSAKFIRIIASISLIAICWMTVLMFSTPKENTEQVETIKAKIKNEQSPIIETRTTLKTQDSLFKKEIHSDKTSRASSNSVEITKDAYGKVVKGKLAKRPPRKKLFKHMCDSQIARVLAIEPGGLIIGTLNYQRNRFVENFKASLKDSNPVVISPDDTEEEVALKEAVIEARSELLSAMNRGEDIADIMQQTEAELHKMQSYRFELRAELAKIQRDEQYTTEDLELFTTAANELLEKRGAKPLACPKLWAIKARLKKETQTKQNQE